MINKDSQKADAPPAAGLTHSRTASEVARLADVSVYTVSRVFSGSSVVAEETRTRVFKVAHELGYTPNAAARALRKGKLDSVGFALPSRELRGEFYGEIFCGFQSELAQKGMMASVISVPTDADPGAWVRNLIISGRCGAMAILFDVEDPCTLDILRPLSVPITVVNYLPEKPKQFAFNSVGFDNSVGVEQAVRHLVSLGHRDIAFISVRPYVWHDINSRIEGFKAGMREAGLAPDMWVIQAGDLEGPAAGTAGVDILFGRSGPKPTAIICVSDFVALGALTAAQRWGKSVPKDLSIIGYDNNFWTQYYTPPLTTVSHMGWDLGKAAARQILSRYESPGMPTEQLIIPTQLIVRQSTCSPEKLLK